MPSKTIKFDASKKKIALAAFAADGRRIAAARAAGVDPRTVDRHRESDPEFGAAWDAAQESFVERLEKEALRRATEGEITVKFDRAGNKVSEERKCSDGLLKLLLQSNAPHKYGSNLKIESRNTNVNVSKTEEEPIDWANLSPAQRSALRTLLREGEEMTTP